MIRGLLLMLIQASPPSAPVKETWEPWLSWGCAVQEGQRRPYVLNGVVARRNDPKLPVEYLRHERALRVLRDDSGALAGKQARAPLFVVRRDEFWARFTNSAGELTQMMTLKVPKAGGAATIELASGRPGSKPYATGRCVTRVEASKAPS